MGRAHLFFLNESPVSSKLCVFVKPCSCFVMTDFGLAFRRTYPSLSKPDHMKIEGKGSNRTTISLSWTDYIIPEQDHMGMISLLIYCVRRGPFIVECTGQASDCTVRASRPHTLDDLMCATWQSTKNLKWDNPVHGNREYSNLYFG